MTDIKENQIGQFGYGFSLILLSKYGQEKRLNRFMLRSISKHSLNY